MSDKLSIWRRVGFAALCLLPLVLLFEAYTVYSDMHTPKTDAILSSTIPFVSTSARTSRVHFLLPATSANDLFCAVTASALATRYPAPYIIGWKGEGMYNATAAHTAKLYGLKRYLDRLPEGGAEDDLVIFGDGHDVMAQLPVDAVVERYFAVAAVADARLADRFGMTVEEARARGLRQTLFFGADKMCWPPVLEEAQCTVKAPSHLSLTLFGPKTGPGDHTYSLARFFNSGSIIGPLGDLRRFINAGIEAIASTYDPDFKHKDSDQIYLARLWGQQEVTRAALLDGGSENDLERDEFHVTLDYESDFVQTGCYSHPWMHMLRYNGSDNTALVTRDMFGQGSKFRPWALQMPAPVFRSLSRVFETLPEDVRKKSSSSARGWIGRLGLETNVATRSIFGFYHATCSKRDLIKDFRRYWFHPFLRPLLEAGARANRDGEAISEKVIDGRRWVYTGSYPAEERDESLGDRRGLGGVFTDFEDEAFIPLASLCKEHWNIFER